MKIPVVRFVLKSSKGPEETFIFMIVRHNKQKLVYSTGIKIIPELWDKKSRSVTEDYKLLKKYPKLGNKDKYVVAYYIQQEANKPYIKLAIIEKSKT